MASYMFCVHGLVHVLCTGKDAYEFAALSSQILIYGGFVLGLVYFVVLFVERGRDST